MDWTTLPPELFEIVLTYLDLDTIKALRLTSRSLAEKCIGPRFLDSIQQPIFELSSEKLHSLYALACNSVLGGRIHSLTILATTLGTSKLEKNVKLGYRAVRQNHGAMVEFTTVDYSPEELSKAKADLDWLREQQKERDNEVPSEMIEVLQHTLERFKKLESINLDGACTISRTERGSSREVEWHSLWMRASHLFSLILKAMVQSGTSVKKLSVYRNTPKCCIPSGHITSYVSCLDQRQLGIMCKGLESLELSMSTEVKNTLALVELSEKTRRLYELYDEAERGNIEREYEDGKLSDGDPRAVLADGTPGITLLLKSASSLRELDLFFRGALNYNTMDSYDRIIESIAQENQFPNLETCAFSGFEAKGESILLFLTKHPNLRSFKLHECSLTAGSWTPIFPYLESMPSLESLSLSSLFGKHLKGSRHASRSTSSSGSDGQGQEEVGGLVNLDPIWDTEGPSRGTSMPAGGPLVHTRYFNREDLKKGLVFRQSSGRPKGSPEIWRWMESRRMLYGPP